MDRIQDPGALAQVARQLRVPILQMIAKANSGHPGGALSAVDIITALYLKHMKHDPANPNWNERDRFILSKGHGVPALYAVLAHCGYFPQDELMGLRMVDSRMQGHPDRMKLPGIEASTGSLGQGLSIGLGMALAAKLDKIDSQVYVMMGDGEIQAGQIWEAMMAAPKLGANNLTAILDYNKIQLDDRVEKILDVGPVKEKAESFGWHVIEIDGHDFPAIVKALDDADAVTDKPVYIVANTVKGKGVSFMEDNVKWHGVAPTPEELEQAVAELQ
jgi:transketolase